MFKYDILNFFNTLKSDVFPLCMALLDTVKLVYTILCCQKVTSERKMYCDLIGILCISVSICFL